MSQSLTPVLPFTPSTSRTPQTLAALTHNNSAPTNNNDIALKKIERSAQEFEALVLSQLLAPIFAEVKQSEITGGSSKNDAFQSMIQEEYAKSIAARGGIGIADQVKASLLAIQANQSVN